MRIGFHLWEVLENAEEVPPGRNWNGSHSSRHDRGYCGSCTACCQIALGYQHQTMDDKPSNNGDGMEELKHLFLDKPFWLVGSMKFQWIGFY